MRFLAGWCLLMFTLTALSAAVLFDLGHTGLGWTAVAGCVLPLAAAWYANETRKEFL